MPRAIQIPTMIPDLHNWNLPSPPGFQGFREDLPLEIDE
jgi:hypothetical protein